jgi:predicted alpha/beta-fold hydrolase
MKHLKLIVYFLSLQCKTVREFDSSYTAKQFGYKDVNDYYANASMHDKLHKIEVPMLCLNAKDDPVQPYEGKWSTCLGFWICNESGNV